MTGDIEQEGPVARGEQVRISQAKGRPMLSWLGKRVPPVLPKDVREPLP